MPPDLSTLKIHVHLSRSLRRRLALLNRSPVAAERYVRNDCAAVARMVKWHTWIGTGRKQFPFLRRNP